MPFCNTETMGLYLAEISLAVVPGAHAVVLMDQAGRHTTGKLEIPGNISIVALPAKCPDLNPLDSIWQFMRGNWLSNQAFISYYDIVDYYCEAWNKLIDQRCRIMTIGRRQWARGSSSMEIGIILATCPNEAISKTADLSSAGPARKMDS